MCSKLFLGIFILGLIGFASPIVGQESRNTGTPLGGQISGQVRYSEGGRPAFDVLVRCDSLNSGSCGQEMTDRSGRFRFTGLAPSQYTLTLRVPGYIEQQQTVELLTTPSANVQFQLKSDGTGKAAKSDPFVIDANVPSGAKKEFDQAAAALASGKKEGIEEGVRHLEKAVSVYPNFVQAQLMLGTAYLDLNQLDKAEQALNKTREIDPKAANALFALGELYLRQKKDEEAEKLLLQGLGIEPRSYQANLSLARVYLDMASKIKDEAQAKPVLEKAYDHLNQSLKINPDLAQAHLLKGNMLLRVRRAADAQHEFEEYLRLDPNGAFAEQTRVVVQKIKKALEAEKKP
jgi:tetratricopeptide (TPR) repeat protein